MFWTGNPDQSLRAEAAGRPITWTRLLRLHRPTAVQRFGLRGAPALERVVLERATGIEPVSLAWKARVLPLHNARSAEALRMSPSFTRQDDVARLMTGQVISGEVGSPFPAGSPFAAGPHRPCTNLQDREDPHRPCPVVRHRQSWRTSDDRSEEQA